MRSLIDLYHAVTMLSRQGPLPISIEGVAYFNKGSQRLTLTEHVVLFDRLFGGDGGKYFVYAEDPRSFEVSECLPPGCHKIAAAVDYCRSKHAEYGLLILDRQIWLMRMRELKDNKSARNDIMADRFLGPHFSGLLGLLEYAEGKNLQVIAGRSNEIEVDINDFDEIG
jgi:hypothetical protein